MAFEPFESILPHNQLHEDRLRVISNSFFVLHYSNDALETTETFQWTKDMNAVLLFSLFLRKLLNRRSRSTV